MRRAVLLDAMGTIVTFGSPVPRLRTLLESRYGLAVSDATAAAAMKAEIARYRRVHDRAVDAPSLAAVRRECADVLRAALGRDEPAALALPLDGADGLTATLVEAIAFEPFPETVAVLTALRERGDRLAVVSNWDVSLLEVLERTGLAPLFATVAISALVGASKPDPRPFTTALDALGVPAAEAIHVGDTYGEDVVGARAAGVRPILVDRSGAVAHDDVAVVADLRGLLALP